MTEQTTKVGLLDRTLGGFGLQRKSASPTSTVGSSGVAAFGGYVQEYEKNAALTGKEKYRTYANILANTSIAAAGIRYFLNVMGRAEWRVEPAEFETDAENAQAEEFAELIENMMTDMTTPWKRVIRRAAMYRFYGFSIQEWTAKRRDDGFFGMMDIEPRPQITIERWDLDETGTVLGIVQRSPQTQQEIYLPRTKTVYIVDDALNDSPEGLGLFRSIVEPSQRLARYEQLEGFGFETDLRGMPLVRIPYAKLRQAVEAGTITAEDAQAAINEMEMFAKKHIKNPQIGVTLESQPYESIGDTINPSSTPQWDLSLLSGEGGNFEAVAQSIERINHEIARVLGVEHLMLGQNRGTQALSHDKSDNFGMIVDSTLDEVREAYQMDFVERVFELNGWDKTFMPKLKTGKIQFRDITQVSQVIKDLAQSGSILMPDDPVVGEIRDELGVSRPIITDEMIEAALPGNPDGDTGSNPNEPDDTGEEEEETE